MQSIRPDRDAAHAVVKELYLVSGAAAQLGAYGLPVQEIQWEALARAARNASGVLGLGAESESEAMTAFRRLAVLCDDLLDRRASGHVCPSGIWRDLARAGRDAYDQICA